MSQALFVFDFLVDRISTARLPEKRPGFQLGARFRLLDFPPVILPLPLRTREMPPQSSETKDSFSSHSVLPGSQRGRLFNAHKKVSRRQTWLVRKGKSCLFELPVIVSNQKQLLVELLDLEVGSTTVHSVLGRGSTSLANVSRVLKDSSQGDRSQAHCSGKSRLEIVSHPPCELVAVLYVKFRLASVTSESPVYKRITEARERCCFMRPVNQALSQSLSTAVGNESEPCVCEDTPCTLAESMRPSEFLDSEKVVEPNCKLTLDSEIVGLDFPVMDDKVTSVEDTDSDGPGELYVPNSICPPPLFYVSQPIPPRGKTTNYCTDKCNGETDPHSSAIELNSVLSHWSALMAYDQNSHPISALPFSSKACESNSGPPPPLPPSPTPPHTPLPLLTALLEELSLLKSHIELVNERVTLPQSCDAELVVKRTNKFVQTEEFHRSSVLQSPAPIKPPRALPRSSKPTQPQYHHTHHVHGSFARACCRYVDPRAGLVPRNKSVIYPPDVAHRRQRRKVAMRRKANLVPRLPPPTGNEYRKAVFASGQVYNRESKKANSTESGSRLMSGENSENVLASQSYFDASSGKLEVFVPQVPITTPASTPLSQSSISLLCKGPSDKTTAAIDAHSANNESALLRLIQPQATSSSSAHTVPSSELVEIATDSQSPLNSGGVDDQSVASISSSGSLKAAQVMSSLESIQQNSYRMPEEAENLNDNITEEKMEAQIAQSVVSPQEAAAVVEYSRNSGLDRRNVSLLQPSSGISIVVTEPPQSSMPHKKAARLPPVKAPPSSTNTKRTVASSSPQLSQDSPLPPFLMSPPVAMSLAGRGKPASLLNLLGSQTLDSFMSTDSLDVEVAGGVRGALLTRERRGSCVLFLASSQSTGSVDDEATKLNDQSVTDEFEGDKNTGPSSVRSSGSGGDGSYILDYSTDFDSDTESS